ncbi:LacI family DNA-binding transcriptional regulator [Ruegeria sp. HKCCD8929]|uniref:LacI family DNA-binding transcriptional regulator n=1 Tax=Ruegeria sp. HKCCD8929 TaxID=2683006 RepID=UPI00148950C1|nr:LacI family DNA-binding transcriptional regulator [Ruegeria sp. HKCCD8929]
MINVEDELFMNEGTGSQSATSHDVARLAGVSQSTVSRVFRRGGVVSPDMRARVMDAAQTLGYRPHAFARSLSTGQSRIIGIVILEKNRHQDYSGSLITWLGKNLAEKGYQIMVFLAPEDIADPGPLIQTILEHRVDGLVISAINISSHFAEECQRARIPVLLFNRHQTDRSVTSITTDDYGGARAIAEHFVERGHQRLSIIVGREDTSTSQDREQGFLDGVHAAGLTLCSRGVGAYDPTIAAEAASALMGVPADNRPSAVFVAGDQMALAVMDTLRFRLGLRIPEDVSVIGFDDIPEAAMPSFNLTTYRLPFRRLARVATDLIIEQIESSKVEPRREVVEGAIVERGSVASL